MLGRICRLFAVAQYCFVIVYDTFFFVVPPLFIFKKELAYVGPQWKFLTTWNLVSCGVEIVAVIMKRDKSINVQSYQLAIMKAMRTLMHLIAFVQFGYGCYYDWYYVRIPSASHSMGFEFAGKFKYLTFWDAVLQTTYFFIAFLNDMFGSNDNKPTKSPVIRRIKDYVFAGLAFPSAMYVGITFWGLWSIDRELVFPKALDEFFPSWLNHLMHTNIMVFIMLEMCLTFRKYPSRKNGLTGMVVFLLAYLIWMHFIYFYSGKWVYPILEVLNWPMKIVFYLASLGLGIILYLVGEFLNNKIWAKQLSQSKKSGKTYSKLK